MKSTTSYVLCLLLVLASVGSSEASKRVDSLLEVSYDYYSYRSFNQAMEAAEKALDLAIERVDSISITKAQFYREIAFQYQQGSYNIEKVQSFETYFREKNLKVDLARSILHLGRTYYNFGDVQAELNQYLKAMDIYEELDDDEGIANVYSRMSLMYYDQHDYDLAFDHIKKAIAIDQKNDDPIILHRDYNNYAIIFEHTGPIDSAIVLHKKALEYGYRSKDPYSIGLSLSNLGNNYVLDKQFDLGKTYLNKALVLRDSIGNSRGLAYTHNRLGKMYNQLGSLRQAQYHAEQSLLHADKTGELKIIRMSYGLLSEIAAAKGDSGMELDYFKKMTALEDSLQNTANTKEITKMMMLHEFDKQSFADSLARVEEARAVELAHQEEIRVKNRIRNLLALSAIFLLMIAGGLYSRWQYIRKSRDVLAKEKERSENLLLNILPAEVAQELKDKGRAEARNFDRASILFTDFITFTQNSEQLSASEIVEELNVCFKAFDGILDKYQIEKIKTIGDAYMAAGGLPVPTAESVKNTVLAAIDMQTFIEKRKKEKLTKGEPAFEMRAGINTGPVVAGIVGTKKFQYDVWGDTVNTANRIENHGQAGKVNISKQTYDLLRDDPDLIFENRGKIQAKGKGEIEMYFVGRAN